MMVRQAYLLLGVGGWLSWRAGQYYPGLAQPMQRWRSRLRERGGSLWCIALFPVVFTTAALMTPDLWWTMTVPGVAWAIIVVAATALLGIRLPTPAATTAVAGVLFLAIC